MSDELKPCPWCGSEAVYDSFLGYCRCTNDKCPFECKPTAAWITKVGVLKDWNTRPLEDALTAENENMRKGLEMIAFMAKNVGDCWLIKEVELILRGGR